MCNVEMPFHDMIVQEMMIKFDVLGSIMEYVIVCQIFSTQIITQDKRLRKHYYMKIIEDRLQP